MPICQIKTNYILSHDQKSKLTGEIADKVSQLVEKPIAAVMVMISDEYMQMNHTEDTVLFAEFRYVKNFSDADEKAAFLKNFADEMLEIFRKYTDVDPYRIYMQFTEMARDSAWKYTK